MRTCVKCGAVVLLFCAACGESREFARPGQPLCEDPPPPAARDFGPPETCTDTSGPHSRWIRVAGLSATSSTGTATVFSFYSSMPLVAFSVHDSDEPGATSGPGDAPSIVGFFPSKS
jgi:hypothetical protein